MEGVLLFPLATARPCPLKKKKMKKLHLQQRCLLQS
jgi:hypothetical protein